MGSGFFGLIQVYGTTKNLSNIPILIKKLILSLFALYGVVLFLSGFGHFLKGNTLIAGLSFVLGLILVVLLFIEERVGFLKALTINVAIVVFTLVGFDAIHPTILKEYYDNGKIHFERTYQGGKQNGIAREFSPDGALLSEANFKNHELNGMVKEYFEDGGLYMESLFENGKKIWSKEYDQNGNLMDAL